MILHLASAVALAAAPPMPSRAFAWETLAERLEGSFSSATQAMTDPDFAEVRCGIVPLWPDRRDFRWLYLERAVPGRPGAPYHQTVYRLGDDPFGKTDERRFELRAYAVADPGRFAGAAEEPSRLDAMAPSDLLARPECSVVLVRGEGGDFTGGTRGRACAGSGPGVAYVTSEWTVEKDALRIWDRGFDEAGRQVWGPTTGPYVFRRVVASSSPEVAP